MQDYLPLSTLLWVNGGLLALWVPVGFMGWAFAAGGAANVAERDPKSARQLRLISYAMAFPYVLLIAALTGPLWLPPDYALLLAWVPLLLAGVLVALGTVASIVAGFVAGLRGDDSDDSKNA